MRKASIAVLVLVVGVVMGAMGSQVLNAQQEQIKRTVLLKTDVTGVEGKEGYIIMVEIAPRGQSGRHYHPGHEFLYVMEGSGMLEIDGKPPVALKTGVTGHIDPKVIHNGKNSSTTAPLKVLVFAVHEKGQPLTIPVK